MTATMQETVGRALESLTGTTPSLDPTNGYGIGQDNPTQPPASVHTLSRDEKRVATRLRPALEAFPSDTWRRKVFNFDETNAAVLKLTKEVESFIKRCCLNRRVNGLVAERSG